MNTSIIFNPSGSTIKSLTQSLESSDGIVVLCKKKKATDCFQPVYCRIVYCCEFAREERELHKNKPEEMVIIGQVTPPNVGLAFTGNNVKLRMGQQTIGSGTVYISQNSLVWQLNDADQEGISIFWKRVGVHGISNAPTKCIYFLIDRQIKWPGIPENPDNANGQAESGNEGSDEDIFEDAEEDQMTECWLLPEDINVVDIMYQAMTECQALHPDSEDSVSGDSDFMEDDGEDEMNAEGFDSCSEDPGYVDDNILATNGDGAAVDNARLNMDNMSLEDDRFADADE